MVVTVYEVSSFIVLVMADFATFFYSIEAVRSSVAGQHIKYIQVIFANSHLF